MKRFFYKKSIMLLLLIFISNLIIGCTSIENNNSFMGSDLKCGEKVLEYDKVKDSIIRFHVIANSDSEKDQNLKLKVKNKVIEYLYDKLNKCKSLDESREVIKENMDEVQKIADDIVKKDNYCAAVELGRENFPEKAYGNVVLPQGNYEAFRVIIGDGQGRNWWCVMFPPLCFVDESKAEVQYDETENQLKEQIDKDSNSEDNDKEENDTIEIKFKIEEVIKDLFK